jgi:hypothetical protein
MSSSFGGDQGEPDSGAQQLSSSISELNLGVPASNPRTVLDYLRTPEGAAMPPTGVLSPDLTVGEASAAAQASHANQDFAKEQELSNLFVGDLARNITEVRLPIALDSLAHSHSDRTISGRCSHRSERSCRSM